MGSGVAKQVRRLYPLAYESYRFICDQEKDNPSGLLGRIQPVRCKAAGSGMGMKTIVNMFAQDRYGYDRNRYTDYKAFEHCLEELLYIAEPGSTIAMPYKIGCGLAGGDWDIVYGLIERILSREYTVELWRMV